jgi:hypothetical protein
MVLASKAADRNWRADYRVSDTRCQFVLRDDVSHHGAAVLRQNRRGAVARHYRDISGVDRPDGHDDWQANLRILDVEEIKTVPYAPMSRPFVERLIARFDGNAWTAPFSGRPPIWR